MTAEGFGKRCCDKKGRCGVQLFRVCCKVITDYELSLPETNVVRNAIEYRIVRNGQAVHSAFDITNAGPEIHRPCPFLAGGNRLV